MGVLEDAPQVNSEERFLDMHDSEDVPCSEPGDASYVTHAVLHEVMNGVLDRLANDNSVRLKGILDQVLDTTDSRCAKLSAQFAERCNQSMQDFKDAFLDKLQTVHQRVVTIENLECASEMRLLRDRISQNEANDVDQVLDALA